jgi:hypothetical protein
MPMPKGEGSPIPFTLHPFHFSFQLEKLVLRKLMNHLGSWMCPNMHHAMQNPMKDLLKLAMVLGYYWKDWEKILGLTW